MHKGVQVLAVAAALVCGWSAAARPVSTIDAVGLARIVEPPVYGAFSGTAWRFSTSPDGRRFAYVVVRPRLPVDRNEYQLIVGDVAQVRAYIAQPQGPLPSGRVVASILARDRNVRVENALRDLRWQGSNALTYLAEDEGGNSQLFLTDLRRGTTRQLTAHAAPVLSYDYNAATGQVVFAAEVYRNPVRDAGDAGNAFIVGDANINSVAAALLDRKWLPTVHFYTIAGPGSEVRPLGIVSAPFLPPLIRISPDGRHVVVEKYLTRSDIPSAWRDAHPLLNRSPRTAPSIDASWGRLGAISTLVLHDFFDRSNASLLDAPTGRMIAGFAIDAAWNGNDRIVLANIFLPPDHVIEGLGETPAVVELEVHSRRLDLIARIDPQAGSRNLSSIGTIELAGVDDLRVMQLTGAQPVRFRRGTTGWQRTEEAAMSGLIRLSVSQTSRTPPEIFAATPGHPEPVRITDLNPQLRAVDFNDVWPFGWTDATGRAWNGALVLPPDMVAGRRYPLVVQTYGYTESAFLIDGNEGMRSAYAAQPMASRGMIVLMLPQPTGLRGRALLLAYRAGVEAAIDELDRLGLIDTSALGVIGFSAMGNVVQDLITFSRHRFAAATIADSWAFSLFGYVTYGSMDEAEGFMRSRPWGSDLATWVERDPSLHTDNITAALRLEQYTPYVLPQWDIYTLLRRQQKPVELVIFPYGAHQLRRPRERFLSLEGNVDWFDFWLNDHDEADPAKAEQYARWRRLRKQRDESRAESAPSNVPALLTRRSMSHEANNQRLATRSSAIRSSRKREDWRSLHEGRNAFFGRASGRLAIPIR